MPVETTSSSTPFHIPTIDLATYLDDPSSPQAELTIDEVRRACLTTGFFQVTNHGISPDLQESVFDAATAFFALPFEAKKKLDAKTNIGGRGYDVLATQAFEADVLPDLKEGFYMGDDIPITDARVQRKRYFMGPNVWPSSDLLAASAFKEPVETYYTAAYNLALLMLSIIARALPYGPHVFDEFTSNDPVATLRLLHYPPAQETEQRQLGASAHTDFGSVSLLMQDGNAGLEVLDSDRGEWVSIAPRKDSYVVNLGDMLPKWTKGLYKSSVHRVVNKNPCDRYSVVLFFEGNLDCSLAPLDGSGVEGGGALTVESHLAERMSRSYGNKGND